MERSKNCLTEPGSANELTKASSLPVDEPSSRINGMPGNRCAKFTPSTYTTTATQSHDNRQRSLILRKKSGGARNSNKAFATKNCALYETEMAAISHPARTCKALPSRQPRSTNNQPTASMAKPNVAPGEICISQC